MSAALFSLSSREAWRERSFWRAKKNTRKGPVAVSSSAVAAGDSADRAAKDQQSTEAGTARLVGDDGEKGEGDGGGPPKWAPLWAVNMHPGLQAAVSVGLYFFHMVRQASVERRGKGMGGQAGGMYSRRRLCYMKT